MEREGDKSFVMDGGERIEVQTSVTVLKSGMLARCSWPVGLSFHILRAQAFATSMICVWRCKQPHLKSEGCYRTLHVHRAAGDGPGPW